MPSAEIDGRHRGTTVDSELYDSLDHPLHSKRKGGIEPIVASRSVNPTQSDSGSEG